jgi:hypothetical protein
MSHVSILHIEPTREPIKEGYACLACAGCMTVLAINAIADIGINNWTGCEALTFGVDIASRRLLNCGGARL